MHERIKETFQDESPDIWGNGEIAKMRFNSSNIWYQVLYCHRVGEGSTVAPNHDEIAGLNDIIKFPIIAQGITAYILRRLKIVSDDKICSDYYQKCLSKYKDIEKNKRGANQRNLDSEFYPIHLREENEKINKSELLFSYLTKDESDVIREFVDYYFDFIEVNYLHHEDESLLRETTDKEMLKVTNNISNKIEIRPIRKFHEYLTSTKQVLLAENLRTEFQGKKGKNIAIMVIALEELGKVAFTHRGEFFKAMTSYFGNIGTESAFNDYYFPYKQGQANRRKPLLTKIDIQPFKTKIDSFGC